MAQQRAITVSCGEGNLGLFRAALGEARRTHCSVTALELVNASGSIDEFLFASEKGMARGANADFDVVVRRARTIRRTASTHDDGFDVIGMNV